MEANTSKLHAVFAPYPMATHINPSLKLAKLIHQKGFHITFFIPEYNYNNILSSLGSNALDGLPDFQFKSLPLNVPPANSLHPTDYFSVLMKSIRANFLPLFRELVHKLNKDESWPKVSCIVSDGVLTQGIVVGEELGIPVALSWTTGAKGFTSIARHRDLVRKCVAGISDGTIDIKSEELDNPILGFIPGRKAMSIREFLNFMQTTHTKEYMNESVVGEVQRTSKSSALIFQSFEGLEKEALDEIRKIIPYVYSIAPFPLLLKNQVNDERVLKLVGDDIWKEDIECSCWLDSMAPNSVLYVSFGSFAITSQQHLIKIAWGLAASKKNFLWIIRADMVVGDVVMTLPEGFIEETKDRGLIKSWCKQEQVLNHPAIGGFFSHCGWNSVLETISAGVPMICWPYFGEQIISSKMVCKEWKFGIEVNENIERGQVENTGKEILEGEKGKIIREKAKEWMQIAKEVTYSDGTSSQNLDKLVNEVLLAKP